MLHRCITQEVSFGWQAEGTQADDSIIDRMSTIPTPDWAAVAYGEIAAAMGFVRPPPLRWVADAFGFGGLYSARRNLILIGEVDLRRIVVDIWTRRIVPIPRGYEWMYTSVVRRGDLYRSAADVVMTHELGHAYRAAAGTSSAGIPEERAADRITGWTREKLGADVHKDELVMDALGCRMDAVLCQHDGPEGRVKTYRAGRNSHRKQMEAAEAQAYAALLAQLNDWSFQPTYG